MQLRSILHVRLVKGRLLDLKLPLEQIDRVFHGGVEDSMNGQPGFVVLVRRLHYVLKEIIDQKVHFRL